MRLWRFEYAVELIEHLKFVDCRCNRVQDTGFCFVISCFCSNVPFIAVFIWVPYYSRACYSSVDNMLNVVQRASGPPQQLFR